MKLLDLFCGAGGSAKGYQLAGFDVTGVDIIHQPRCAADVFIQADALEYLAVHGHEYDYIHASPPCKKYTQMTAIRIDASEVRASYPEMITPTRELLKQIGKPYVIENVPAAAKLLIKPIMLCGSMFGLRVIRHRFFESSMELLPPSPCFHKGTVQDGFYCGVYGTGGAMMRDDGKGRRQGSRRVEDWRLAMGIDWMLKTELTQAIPPAFTEWIGQQLVTPIQMKMF